MASNVPFVITEFGPLSIGTTVFSLMSGNTTLQSITTACEVEVYVDVSSMASGDGYDFTVFEKCGTGSQQQIVDVSLSNAQTNGMLRLGPYRLSDGWDFRAQQKSGTVKTFRWTIKQDINWVNTDTITSGAITSASLASSAITAIQSGLATATAVAAVAANAASAVFATVIEGSTTFIQSIRGHNSVLMGLASGFNTPNRIFRDLANSKNRVVSTTDGSGRTAVTLDLT